MKTTIDKNYIRTRVESLEANKEEIENEKKSSGDDNERSKSIRSESRRNNKPAPKRIMNQTTINEEISYGVNMRPPIGYKTMCVLNLLFSSVAFVVCAILAVAMMAPLLNPKRRKYYSTYNLYLAFMAVPFLISHALIVYLVLRHHHWHPRLFLNSDANAGEDITNNLLWMFDHFWDGGIYAMNATSILYINAFLTYELYKLLENSNQRKKHHPPTIDKVIRQSMISYALGIVIFLVEFFVSDVVEDKPMWSAVYQASILICVAVIPLSIMGWFSFQMFRQEFFRSTKSMYEGRLRILVVCFARIILSSLLLWIPAVSLHFVSLTTETVGPTKIFSYNISLLFMAFQSIAIFGCSVAKPDTRMFLEDLLCCRCYGGDDSSDSGDNTNKPSSDMDPYLSRFSEEAAVAVEGTRFSCPSGDENDSQPGDNDTSCVLSFAEPSEVEQP